MTSGSQHANDLSNLNDEQVSDLRQTLRHLIDHIARRIEYAEARRGSLAIIAAALIAAGVAVLPVALTQADERLVVLPLSTVAAVAVVTGLTMWFVYAKQTNFPYPFVGVATTWKWFYHYALNAKEFAAPWHGFVSKKVREAGKSAYLSQWPEFREKQTTGLVNIRVDALQDLEQVYLLHVNERYKNLFLTHLRSVLNWGLIAAVILTAAAFIFALGLDEFGGSGNLETSKSVNYQSTQITTDASWRTTARSRMIASVGQETEVLVNIGVSNERPNDFAVKSVTAKDRFELTLPSTLESITPDSLTLHAQASAEIIVLVWIPDSLVDDIDHFEVSD